MGSHGCLMQLVASGAQDKTLGKREAISFEELGDFVESGDGCYKLTVPRQSDLLKNFNIVFTNNYKCNIYNYIEEISLSANGSIISKIDGPSLFMKNMMLHKNTENLLKHNIVPIFFDTNILLCALPYSEIHLEIRINNYQMKEDYIVSYRKKINNQLNTIFYKDLQNCISNMIGEELPTTLSLYCDNVFCDNVERQVYAQNPRMVNILQNQCKKETLYNKKTRIRLNFNHPVTSILFMVTDKNNNIMSGKHPIKRVKLEMNGQGRMMGDAKYFHVLDKLRRKNKEIPKEFIYSMTFHDEEEIFKEDFNRTINFSRLDDVSFLIEKEDFVPDDAILHILAINVNIMMVSGGMVGVRYAN